jgi:hypothetical protein
MNSAITTLNPPANATQTICFRINGNGDVLGGRVTIAFDGVTLEFR